MSRYLSIDTEATGLEEDTHLIQLAFVPVDVSEGKVYLELGWERLVKCPDFEELKPRLNPWVLENMADLIRKAHAEGISLETCQDEVTQYLQSDAIQAFFGGKPPVLLGKSLSALDIPLLNRSLGWKYMQKAFHHHNLDVTSMAISLCDSGLLPAGTTGSSQLMKHYQLKDGTEHTALSDAIEMADIYIKMVKDIKAHTQK